MILERIERYLAERKRAPLADLARHLGSDPDALRGMLAVLERKGRLHKLESMRCGGCTRCDPATLEVYEWSGGEAGGVAV